MDPTESLEEIREAIKCGDLGTACDKFIGLDRWLSNRGFAPEPWRRIEPRLADMERRAYRLRCALREAGVPENLVRAVELGGNVAEEEEEEEEERARALARGALVEAGVPIRMIRTEEERRQGPRGGDL